MWIIGFDDNLEDHTFGIVKKGVYTPCSDLFNIKAEVNCTIPSSSGYGCGVNSFQRKQNKVMSL